MLLWTGMVALAVASARAATAATEAGAVNTVLRALGVKAQWTGCADLFGTDTFTHVRCDDAGRVTHLDVDTADARHAARLDTAITTLTHLTHLEVRCSPRGGDVRYLSGTLPALTALTRLHTLRVASAALHGRVPAGLNQLPLKTCDLISSISRNRFCCPLPSDIHDACLSDDTTAAELRCTPLVSCDGHMLPPGASTSPVLDQLIGQWDGLFHSSYALFAASEKSSMLPACVQPYKQTALVRIDENFEISFVFLSSAAVDIHALDGVQPPFLMKPYKLWPFDSGYIRSYDENLSRAAYLTATGGSSSESLKANEIFVKCIYIKQEGDRLKIWLARQSGSYDWCDQPYTKFLEKSECVSRTAQSANYPRDTEKMLNAFGAEFTVSYFELQRANTGGDAASGDSNAVNLDDAASEAFEKVGDDVPVAATTNPSTPSDSGGLGTLAIVIIVVVVLLCCLVLCVALVAALYVWHTRKKKAEALEGNPLYMQPQHNASPRKSRGSQGLRTSQQASPRTPEGSVRMPYRAPPKNFSAQEFSFGKAVIAPNQIQRGKKIGEGAFGVVYVGDWRGITVAIKECIGEGPDKQISSAYNLANMSDPELEKFKQEARRLQELAPHGNIVSFYGVCLEPTFALICQFCEGGSLDTLLESNEQLTVGRRWRWLHGIAAGCEHLHQQGIVHRDIAARNVLLTSDDVAKLSDFGMAREGNGSYSTGKTTSQVGPVKWMAPEQLSELSFSVKSDTWMFGCVIFECFNRRIPWHDLELPKAIFNIMSGVLLEMSPDTPSPLYDLAHRCWQFEPSQRPKISQVVADLKLHGTDYLARLGENTLNTFEIASTTVLSKSPGIKCPHCGKPYQTQADIDKHVALRHSQMHAM